MEKNLTADSEPAKLADFVSETSKERLPGLAWLKVAVLGGAFCLLCLSSKQFQVLGHQWLGDPNWTWGFIIPLFSLYLIYIRWDRILAAKRGICIWGLPVFLFGLAMMILSLYPIQNRWFSQLSMVLALLGLVLYMTGPKVTFLLFVPIAYLAIAMPFPKSLYEQIAYELQEFAASMSFGLLKLAGAEITIKASNLRITSLSGEVYPVEVAEACSGLRSLMAFLALGIAIAYIEERPLWQRIVLMLSGLPIAIVCNVLRVTVTASMYVWDKPEAGEGFMHWATGMLLLVPALLLFLGLGKLLDWFYLEEDEDEDEDESENKPTDVSAAEDATL